MTDETTQPSIPEIDDQNIDQGIPSDNATPATQQVQQDLFPDQNLQYGQPQMDQSVRYFIAGAYDKSSRFLSNMLDHVDKIKVSDNTLDKQGMQQTAASMAVLHHYTGVEPEEIAKDYNAYRKSVAAQWGEKTPRNDGEFVQMARKHINSSLNLSDALNEAFYQGIRDNMDPSKSKDPVTAEQEFNTEHAVRIADLDEKERHNGFTSMYDRGVAVTQSPLFDLAKQTVSTFKDTGSLEEWGQNLKNIMPSGNEEFPEAPKDLGPKQQFAQDLANTVGGMTPQQQDEFFHTVALVKAAQGDDKASIGQWFNELGQTLSRGIESIGSDITQPFQRSLYATQSDIGMLTGNPDLTKEADENTKALNIQSRIKAAADNIINPLHEYGTATDITRGVVGALPWMAAFAVDPVIGIGAMGLNNIGEVQNVIRQNNPDIPQGELNIISGLTAAPMTAFQSLSMGTAFRAFPWLEQRLATMTGGGLINQVLHAGITTGGMAAGDISALIGQGIAKAFDPEIKTGTPLSDQLVDLIMKQPEQAAVFSIISLVGAGVHKLRGGDSDEVQIAKSVARSLRNEQALREMGWTNEQIADAQNTPMSEVLSKVIQIQSEIRADSVAQGKELAQKENILSRLFADSPETPTMIKLENGNWRILVPDSKGVLQNAGETSDFDVANSRLQRLEAFYVNGRLKDFNNLVDYMQKVWESQGIENRTLETPSEPNKTVQEHLDQKESSLSEEELRLRVALAGGHENDSLSSSIIEGYTTNEWREKVYHDIIKVLDHSPVTLLHESSDAHTNRAIAMGKFTHQDLVRWIRQTEAGMKAIDGQDHQYLDPANESNPAAIVEANTALFLDFAAGKFAAHDAAPSALRGFFKALLRYFQGVLAKAKVLHQAIEKGTVPKEYHQHLAETMGLDTEGRLATKEGKETAALLGSPDNLTQAQLFSIRVNTVAANQLADAVGVPRMLGPEFIGRKMIPIEADLTAGGGNFTKKPAQGGPAFSVIKEYFQKKIGWAAAKDGFWTGKLNLARKEGAIYTGADGREKFLVTPYAMKQDSHVSNPTIAGEKLAEVSRYVSEGRISPENEHALAGLIVDAATKNAEKFTKAVNEAKAKLQSLEKSGASQDAIDEAKKAVTKLQTSKTFNEGLMDFPRKFTAAEFDAYLDSKSFEQRAFIAEKLSSAAAEKLGAPPMQQIQRATLDKSYHGTPHLSMVSALEIDVQRLEDGLKNGTLTSKDFGITPHNSYKSFAPGSPAAFFRTPIPYEYAYPDIRQGLNDAGYTENHAYYLKGKIPKGVPKTQTISKEMLDHWNLTQTSLMPNQAKAVVEALNGNWKVMDTAGAAGVAAFSRALFNNDAASTLTQYSKSDLSKLLKAGKMKIFRLGEQEIWFALKRPDGSEFDPGDPEKDWSIVGVANNEGGAPGVLPIIMAKAIKEGGTRLDCFEVISEKYPQGLLPTLYARSGFEIRKGVEFDESYHQEPGKLDDMKKVWEDQGWDGQKPPRVVWMEHNPEAYARQFADPDHRTYFANAAKDERSVALASDQVPGAESDSPSGEMGGEGSGGEGGRLPNGSGAARNARNADDILSRGVESVVAKLKSATEQQLKALGLTREAVDSALGKFDAYQENGTSFSIKARDNSYDEAVKSGDTESQQRLVDEAAHEAGYTTAAFHGTPREFNQFMGPNPFSSAKPRTTGSRALGKRFINYFSTNRDVSELYSKNLLPTGKERVLRVYLKLENPLILQGKEGQTWADFTHQVAEAYDSGKYDGVIMKDISDEHKITKDNYTRLSTTIAVFRKPEGIKLADPITRDAEGNVIPLSQRFDENSRDINYSIRTKADVDRVNAEFDRQMVNSPTRRREIMERAAARFGKVQESMAEINKDLDAAIDKRVAYFDKRAAEQKQKDIEKLGENPPPEQLQAIEDKYSDKNIRSRAIAEARLKMEQNLVTLGAIMRTLPQEIRGTFGNPYTEFAKKSTDKAKANYLVNMIQRMSSAIDANLRESFVDKAYDLYRAASPKSKAGKPVVGKITPEGHALLEKIYDLWHLSGAEVDSKINTLKHDLSALADNDKLSDIEKEKEKDRILQEIALTNLHGNFSPYRIEKTIEGTKQVPKGSDNPDKSAAESEQVVEHLKDIIDTGRLAVKQAKNLRAEEIKARVEGLTQLILGREGNASTPEVNKGKDASRGYIAGIRKLVDMHYTNTQLLDHIFGPVVGENLADRIYKAVNAEFDANHQSEAEAVRFLLDGIVGPNAPRGMKNERVIKKALASLSTRKKTGISTIENLKLSSRKILLGDARALTKKDWKGLDYDYQKLLFTLARIDGNPNSKVESLDIREIDPNSGDKVDDLELSEFEAMQRLLLWRQSRYRRTLELSGMNDTVAGKLEAFVNKTKEGQVFYQFLRDHAYNDYDKINAMYKKQFGISMPRTDNYASASGSWEVKDDTDEAKLLGEHAGGASSTPGFAIERQNHVAKLKDSNAWTNWLSHTRAVNYWLTHVELNRDLQSTLGSQDVLRALATRGNNEEKKVSAILKSIAQEDRTSSKIMRDAENLAQAFASYGATSILGLNPKVAVKHLTSAVSAAMVLDPAEFLASAARVASGQGMMPLHVAFNSEEVKRFVQASHGDLTRDGVSLANRSGTVQDLAIAGQSLGEFAHSWIPNFMRLSNTATAAIVYDAEYRSAVKDGLSEAQAHQVAKDRVNAVLHKVNPVGFGIDQPALEAKSPIMALMQRFAGPVRQGLGITMHELETLGRDVKNAPEGEGLSVAVNKLAKAGAAWALPGLVEAAMMQGLSALIGSSQEQEDTSHWDEYLAAVLAGRFYGFFWVGSTISQGIKAYVTGKQTPPQDSLPLVQYVKSLGKSGKNILGGKGEAEDYIAATRAGVDMTAAALIFMHQYALAGALAGVSATANVVKPTINAGRNMGLIPESAQSVKHRKGLIEKLGG